MSYFTNIAVQNVNKGFVYITDLTWSLNILPLEHSRELYANLTVLLYKIKNNLINVTFNQYLIPVTNPYATRNFDPNNYNKIVFNNQEFFRQSYFPRSVILWMPPIPYRSSSRPFPTDLQAPSTLLLQSQTVYLHTTIDNYTLKFVVQYPKAGVTRATKLL